MHESVSELGVIPPAVLERAASTIANQPILPLSPAETEGDTLNMCAAACLADAGYRLLVSDERAENFIESLEHTASKSVVEEAFAVLGWSREACRQAMKFNDSLSPTDRKSRVLNLFESFVRSNSA